MRVSDVKLARFARQLPGPKGPRVSKAAGPLLDRRFHRGPARPAPGGTQSRGVLLSPVPALTPYLLFFNGFLNFRDVRGRTHNRQRRPFGRSAYRPGTRPRTPEGRRNRTSHREHRNRRTHRVPHPPCRQFRWDTCRRTPALLRHCTASPRSGPGSTRSSQPRRDQRRLHRPPPVNTHHHTPDIGWPCTPASAAWSW